MFKPGTKVEWKWLGRKIPGVVLEVHIDKIIKEIKGKKITRNGTKDNPAYVVESDAGNIALKLETELSLRSAADTKKTPKLFSN